PPEEKPKQTLKQVKPPKPPRPGIGGSRTKKTAIPPEKLLRQEENNRILGERGEELVLDYEKNKLREAGRSDLAERVHHIALLDSSAGYDIVSFDEASGDEIFIEVKTTKYARNRPFFISRNEVLKSESLGDSYKIYRVFGLNPDVKDASEVEFYIKTGSVTEQFELMPTSYSASIKQND
ncbi:hypothetical protein CMO91_00490, partial [Candidatus Woesearchaeota archaeon]|nr:hypothetical protein [Candidatus Woesearchaeota archaeon]